jgi:subtilisin family serine protease
VLDCQRASLPVHGPASTLRRRRRAGFTDNGVRCKQQYLGELRGMAVTATEAQLVTLLTTYTSQVKYAERDGVVTVADGSMSQPSAPWNLDRIDARDGLDDTFSYTTTGAGVTIYVIDTGVRVTHSEFAHADGSPGTRAYSAYDFVDRDYDAADCNGCGLRACPNPNPNPNPYPNPNPNPNPNPGP